MPLKSLIRTRVVFTILRGQLTICSLSPRVVEDPDEPICIVVVVMIYRENVDGWVMVQLIPLNVSRCWRIVGAYPGRISWPSSEYGLFYSAPLPDCSAFLRHLVATFKASASSSILLYLEDSTRQDLGKGQHRSDIFIIIPWSFVHPFVSLRVTFIRFSNIIKRLGGNVSPD